MILQTLVAIIVYPGIVLVLALGLLHAELSQNGLRAGLLFRSITNASAWKSGEGLMSGLSIILAGVGLACLPWPLFSAASAYPGHMLLAWGGLEGAFLVALLPGLLAGSPPVVRAAIREAQIGIAGRALLWIAVGVGLALHTEWSLYGQGRLSPLLAHLLALLAAGFAFPAAIGWGPFAAEQSITPGGVHQGLDTSTVRLAQAAHICRVGALLAASLLAVLPVGAINPWLGMVLLIAAYIGCTMLFKRMEGTQPRYTLAEALQACWWRALPLAGAAVICLMGSSG